MSLILDALRRAEAERQLGLPPDLQRVAAASPPAPPRGPRRVMLLVGLVIVAACSWWFGRLAGQSTGEADRPPIAASGPIAPAVPAARTLARAAASAAQPAETAEGGEAGSAAASSTRESAGGPLVEDRNRGSMAARRGASPSQPSLRAERAGVLSGSRIPVPKASAPTGPDDSQGAIRAGIPISRMDPALRSQLPPLRFGGAIQSDQAARRLVIIDGQVYREGDRIIPGLVVVQIRPDAVTLAYRGENYAAPL